MTDEAGWVRVGSRTQLIERRRLICRVGKISIVLFCSGAEVMALEDKCSHLGMPLHDGRIIGGTIICPFHGACFNLRTGEAISGPAVSAVRTFSTLLDDQDVLLQLPPPVDS